MATENFTAKHPGLCRVCRGVVKAGDIAVEIVIPGKDRARWAHAACGVLVANGGRVWDASAGVDGDFVVGHPTVTASETPATVATETKEPTTAEGAGDLAKKLAANSDVVEVSGYVIKIGAVDLEGAWLYGGEVVGDVPDEKLDWMAKSPRGQFDTTDAAKLAAVNQLSAMALDKWTGAENRENKKRLGNMAEAINKVAEALEDKVKGDEKQAKKDAAKTEAKPEETTDAKPDASTESKPEGAGEGAADVPPEPKPEGKPKRNRKKKGEGDGQGEQAAEPKADESAAPTPPPEPPATPPAAGSDGPGETPPDEPKADESEAEADGEGEAEEAENPLLAAIDARVRSVVGPMLDARFGAWASQAGNTTLATQVAATSGPRHQPASYTLPDVRHEKFGDVLDLAKARRNILLVGPSQAGKTTLAEQVATTLGLPFRCIGCSIGMSESQLKGRLVPTGEGGQFEYQISALVDAYENGGVCLVDEIDAGGPDVLVAINAPLSNDWIPVEARVANPIARRHPDFICIASANTFGSGADRMYVGRQQLDFATLQRFAVGQVELGYSQAIERAVCPDDAIRNALVRCRAAIDRLNTASAYTIRRTVSTRFLADSYVMKTSAGWDIERIFTALVCGWSRDEVSRVMDELKQMEQSTNAK